MIEGRAGDRPHRGWRRIPMSIATPLTTRREGGEWPGLLQVLASAFRFMVDRLGRQPLAYEK